MDKELYRCEDFITIREIIEEPNVKPITHFNTKDYPSMERRHSTLGKWVPYDVFRNRSQ